MLLLTNLAITEPSASISVTITNSSFSDNTATSKGGHIFLDYETIDISNCIFVRGKAENGGGIYFVKLSNNFDNSYL